MPSINVYLAASLAERLERNKEVVKVSEVCQTALTSALDAAEAASRGDKLPLIIERLKRTKSPREQARANGYMLGREWAESTASMEELREVARLVNIARQCYADRSSFKRHASGRVSFIYRERDQQDADDDRTWLPETVPYDFFVVASKTIYFDASVWGFIEGATSLWDEVAQVLSSEAQEGVPLE